jgi:hypothetical protein
MVDLTSGASVMSILVKGREKKLAFSAPLGGMTKSFLTNSKGARVTQSAAADRKQLI